MGPRAVVIRPTPLGRKVASASASRGTHLQHAPTASPALTLRCAPLMPGYSEGTQRGGAKPAPPPSLQTLISERPQGTPGAAWAADLDLGATSGDARRCVGGRAPSLRGRQGTFAHAIIVVHTCGANAPRALATAACDSAVGVRASINPPRPVPLILAPSAPAARAAKTRSSSSLQLPHARRRVGGG